MMELLDTVVLLRDLGEHDLRAGDLGAVVEIYSPEAVEVEFVSAGGETRALVTVPAGLLRRLEPTDVMSVRRSRSAGMAAARLRR
jgi:hypothetical protein